MSLLGKGGGGHPESPLEIPVMWHDVSGGILFLKRGKTSALYKASRLNCS